MSILSGIGQIPQIFGGNGGMVAEIEYEIPANIDMVANPVGYVLPTTNVPNGEYLVYVGLSVECNDATTDTSLLTITLDANGNGQTVNLLYNVANLASEWYPATLFYANVTDGTLAVGYVLQQAGNTGGYNINLSAQINGSLGVVAYRLTYPIL
jgi:hypothetical protein